MWFQNKASLAFAFTSENKLFENSVFQMNAETAAAATPLPVGVQEKLLALKDALLSQNPAYATILNTLHAETKGHPEYVYALSDEELQTIFAGYEKFSNLKILEGTPKQKGVTKKVGASLSLDDI